MIGMDRSTGRTLSGWPHIMQSVADILTTRTGTRVQRRTYGSEAMALVDRPSNAEAILDRFVSIATALDAWEPRVELKGFQLVTANADGAPTILVELVARENGSLQTVEVAA